MNLIDKAFMKMRDNQGWNLGNNNLKDFRYVLDYHIDTLKELWELANEESEYVYVEVQREKLENMSGFLIDFMQALLEANKESEEIKND